MLKLIRWKNLLIMAFTMFIMHYVLVYGLIKHHTILHYSHILHKTQALSFDFDLQLSHLNFIILVVSVLLIAAGGYIVNDVMDKKIDLLNKPDEVIIDKKISEKTAISLYYILNSVGFLLALYLSWKVGLWQLSIIFGLVIGLLYFYSSNYQKIPLVGNLTVALLVAIVPLLVPVYDILELHRIYRPTLLNYEFSFNFLFKWVGGFAFFAFLSTLIREIVKDAEDFEGDRAHGLKTLAIVLSEKWVKTIIIILTFILIAIVVYINFFYFPNHLELKYVFSPNDSWLQSLRPDKLSNWYSIIALILPALFIIFQVSKASSTKDYKIASNGLKILMITGILYSFILAYSFLNYQIVVQ